MQELLEFDEDTAGGMMNTEYVALHENASVTDALAALRGNEDLLETLNTLFLVDARRTADGVGSAGAAVPAAGGALLKDLASETLIQVTVDETQDRVTETVRQIQSAGAAGGGRRRQAGRRDHGRRHHFRAEAEVSGCRKLLSRFRYQIAVFLAVLGPGFITAMVDNDSGGIYHLFGGRRASTATCRCGRCCRSPLVLIITQEMCSRMGAVTGKGLSDLIREEFGLRITFLMMALLVLANLTNVMAEFAGIASSLELFHISRYISVPLAAAGGLVAGGERQLPQRGEDLPLRLRLLCHLHHFRHSW